MNLHRILWCLIKFLTTCVTCIISMLLLSTHSLDPCLWAGGYGHPAFGLPVSLSLHLASSSITPAGSVRKSRGDSVGVGAVEEMVCVMCVGVAKWA